MNHFSWRHLLLIWLAMLVSSCATGPAFTPLATPGPSEAVFYAYRIPAIREAGVTPNLFVGERDLGTLVGGGYIGIKVPPGMHRFSLRCTNIMKCQFSERPFIVSLQPGQITYYRYTVDVYSEAARTVVRHSLLPAPTGEAENEILGMKKIEP